MENVRPSYQLRAGSELRRAYNWPLHKAVTNGTLHKDHIAFFLAFGISIDEKDQEGRTPLHLAVSLFPPRLEFVKELLDFGASIGAKDFEGNTPLHRAVMVPAQTQSIQLDIVKELLGRGADINAVNCHRFTPLTIAIRQDSVNLDLVELLLRKGANPNQPIDQAPLFIAFHTKNIDHYLIKLLMDSGANVQTKFESQRLSVLHYAAQHPKCEPKLINELLSRDVDVNVRDLFYNTPLHYAVKFHCNLSIIEALLKAGADASAETRFELTPLHKAVMNENCSESVIRLLVNYGANIDAQCGQGQTPLLYALKATWNSERIIAELLKNGANPNITDFHELSALHYAVENITCSAKIIRALLQNGADVNYGETSGNGTPLDWALRNNPCNVNVVKELLRNRARLSSHFSQESPLRSLLKSKDVNASVVHAILKHQNSQYLRNHGDLICVALQNHHCSYEVLEELFKYGADVRIKNSQGKSALEIALEESVPKMNIIKLFLNHRAFAVKDKLPWDKAVKTVWCHLKGEDTWPFLMLLIKYAVLQKFGYVKIPSCDSCSQIDVKKLIIYMEKCAVECEKMSTELLPCNISLHDLVMGDKECDDSCQSEILNLLVKKFYPIYFDVILHKIKRSKLVEKLLNQKIYFRCNKPFSHDIVLNADCVRKFEGYLPKETIYNILTVFYTED
ncbi:putative ankyrin repeat protein-like protein [Argiope bruennichi]|uniref:Putative ankyrin repeat protein-like protein n=1 Tax=Argiope bruennichi TaxID=94029 RepID=A0A8T0F1R3_ARGBR|nr:putative ankyrin repeat protein-like protein [Argiope bruennichi]